MEEMNRQECAEFRTLTHTTSHVGAAEGMSETKPHCLVLTHTHAHALRSLHTSTAQGVKFGGVSPIPRPFNNLSTSIVRT